MKLRRRHYIRIGRVTNRVARIGVNVRLRVTEQNSDDSPHFENGQLVFGLRGNPQQQIVIERTHNVSEWATSGSLWLSSSGSGRFREAVPTGTVALYRIREGSVEVISAGDLMKNGEPYRSWRVSGGRAGQQYILEETTDNGGNWKEFRTNIVQAADWFFEVPLSKGAVYRIKR